jgi:hypothetical protein
MMEVQKRPAMPTAGLRAAPMLANGTRRARRSAERRYASALRPPAATIDAPKRPSILEPHAILGFVLTEALPSQQGRFVAE